MLFTLYKAGEVSFHLIGTNGFHVSQRMKDLLLSDYSMLFTLYKAGEVSFHLIGTNGFHVSQRMKDLLLQVRVVIRTSNMKISRRRLSNYSDINFLLIKLSTSSFRYLNMHVDVLKRTSDLVFLKENGKGMHQNENRTCGACRESTTCGACST